jgi:hypothetical protein
MQLAQGREGGRLMAWIESHQDLRTNPKAKRLARLLDVPLAQAIGHLHMLWWWALDHAEDGNLGRVDAYDIADGADWQGDEHAFVQALIDCGPGDRTGFVERAASGHLLLHDWHEYTLALRASREGSARGNHTRWHTKRGIQDPSCPFCASPPDSPPISPPISPPTSGPNRVGVAPESGPTSTNQPTNQPTNQGAAREGAEDGPGHPPPVSNGHPKTPTRWDHAWARIQTYVKQYGSQDPTRPPPDEFFDQHTLAVLRSIGGTSAVRRDEIGKFDFRDAWKEHPEP